MLVFQYIMLHSGYIEMRKELVLKNKPQILTFNIWAKCHEYDLKMNGSSCKLEERLHSIRKWNVCSTQHMYVSIDYTLCICQLTTQNLCCLVNYVWTSLLVICISNWNEFHVFFTKYYEHVVLIKQLTAAGMGPMHHDTKLC